VIMMNSDVLCEFLAKVFELLDDGVSSFSSQSYAPFPLQLKLDKHSLKAAQTTRGILLKNQNYI
jgi:hypothetical protein